jgi:Mevalonate kinase
MKVVSFAPAKLTLLGEHAVVYGKNALAMAINKGIKTIIEENKESDLLIESADVLIQGVKLKVNEGKTEAYSSINFSLSVLSYVIASIRKVEERIGDKVRGINIKIRSELPVRAGLGTSASVVVSTVAGLMEFFGKSFSREEIAKISWEVEREVQGTASPMDTYTSSLGGILLIRSEGEKAFFERLERLPQLPIVIGYVNKEISTKN